MLSFVTCHSLPINLMTANHSTGCKPYLVCKVMTIKQKDILKSKDKETIDLKQANKVKSQNLK